MEGELPILLPDRRWYENHRDPSTLTASTYQKVKRLIDMGVTLAVAPFVLPCLCLIGAAVWLNSPGPILFVQKRTGQGGRRFNMYKVRTMVPDAEALKKELQHLNELTYPDFKITNDPRITIVGRFLRKTSLDELPQFFNVLKGDMSLVGPRPTSFRAETYSLWHTTRLEIRPGITGVWQVAGRNELDFDERLRLDISYVRNQCLSLDFEILLRTIGAVFSRRGAN